MNNRRPDTAKLQAKLFIDLFNAFELFHTLAMPAYEKVKHCLESRYLSEEDQEAMTQASRMERSMSIGGFLTQFAALESFINCVHRDFGRWDTSSLPEQFAVGPAKGKLAHLRTDKFVDWPIIYRAFLLVSLCSDKLILPNQVFRTEESDWKALLEVFMIHRWFSKPADIVVDLRTQDGAQPVIVNNPEYTENLWPITNCPRHPGMMGLADLFSLNSRIVWYLQEVARFLPNQVTDSYLSRDKLKL